MAPETEEVGCWPLLLASHMVSGQVELFTEPRKEVEKLVRGNVERLAAIPRLEERDTTQLSGQEILGVGCGWWENGAAVLEERAEIIHLHPTAEEHPEPSWPKGKNRSEMTVCAKRESPTLVGSMNLLTRR